MNILDILLLHYGLNREKLARLSDISTSTLHKITKSASGSDGISGRTCSEVYKGISLDKNNLKMSPGKILDEFIIIDKILKEFDSLISNFLVPDEQKKFIFNNKFEPPNSKIRRTNLIFSKGSPKKVSSTEYLTNQKELYQVLVLMVFEEIISSYSSYSRTNNFEEIDSNIKTQCSFTIEYLKYFKENKV